jgi:hypothetical protein
MKGKWMLESTTTICMAAPHMLINSMRNEKPLVIERNPSSYMLREPLIQAVKIFGLLSALTNKVEWQFTN